LFDGVLECAWGSFNASSRGDLGAKGFGGDVGNLQPNKTFYLKFNGIFGGPIMHKIDSKPNRNKALYTNKSKINFNNLFL